MIEYQLFSNMSLRIENEQLKKENKTLKDREEGFKKQIIGLYEKYYQVYEERLKEHCNELELINQKVMEENERLQEMMITCNEKIDDLRRINKKLKTKLENTERKIRKISQKCYEVEDIESIISDLDNLSMELEE